MKKISKSYSLSLSNLEIWMWELEGYDHKKAQFCLEYVISGYIVKKYGTSSVVRKRMKLLEELYDVKFPKVNWKLIVGYDKGDDFISKMYKWENK